MRLVSLLFLGFCAQLAHSVVIHPRGVDDDGEIRSRETTDTVVLPLGSQNGPRSFKSAVGAYRHVMRKHGKKGHKRFSVDAVDVLPSYDAEYTIDVHIGTPSKLLKLQLDTGSSDFWVWSNLLPPNETVGRRMYQPKKSSTAKHMAGETWSIMYGMDADPDAAGIVYTDKVKIGNVTIPKQAVEVANYVSQSIIADTIDGVLGLAFNTLNQAWPTKLLTAFDNMIENGLVKTPVFTVSLDRGDSKGFVSFGSIQAARAHVKAKSIHYTHIQNTGYWQFPSTYAIVNGQKVSVPGNTAILDSGTSLIMTVEPIVKAVYAKIPGAKFDSTLQLWVYPTKAKIPTVAFTVGSKSYTLRPEDFSYGGDQGGVTIGSIQSRGTLQFDILGDAFFKSTYVVFDQGQRRVGVAQR